MGAAWYVSPPSEEMCREVEELGIAAPPVNDNAVSPTPEQVFQTLKGFPEYRVSLRRGSYKRPAKHTVEQAIHLDLRRQDGSYAIEINLLSVTDDDQPALLVFPYGKVDEVVQIVTKLAETCGPLLLWHDSGETPIVVYPVNAAEPHADAIRRI